MRFSPSGSCCGGECAFYQDGFSDGDLGDFQAEVGSWEDEAGASGLFTSDEDAHIIYRGGIITPGELWRLKAVPTKHLSDFANWTSKHRIIFDWTDANNYWYAEFVAAVASSSSQGTTIKIVQVSGGTHTTQAGPSSAQTSQSEHAVCYQDGVIKAYQVSLEASAVSYSPASPLSGGEFGLGTGTGWSGISATGFDDFELSIDSQGGGNCDDCP